MRGPGSRAQEEFTDMLSDSPLFIQFSNRNTIETLEQNGLPLYLHFKSVEEKLKRNNDLYDRIKVKSFIPVKSFDRLYSPLNSSPKYLELPNDSLKKTNEFLDYFNNILEQMMVRSSKSTNTSH